MGNQRYKDGFGPCKRPTKSKSSRLWKKSADQARRTHLNFMVPTENRYSGANKRVGDALSTEKARRSPLEKSTKNNLAQPLSSRLNNGSSRLDIKKPMPFSSVPNLVSPQKNVGLLSPQQNKTGKSMPSLLRPNDVRVSRQKNKKTDKSTPSPLRPNDVRVSRQKMSGSSRLNNGKIPLHRNIDNATPSSSRPTDVLCSPRNYTNNPISSSSRSNDRVISSQKNRKFSSRSNNGSISSQKNVKKPQPSSSTPNNGLVNPGESTKKRKPSSSRPDNGGASLSKNIEMPRPSPSRPNNDNGGASSLKNIEMSRPSTSRPNNDMISSPKDIETCGPSSPNDVSVPLKNTERFMSAKSRPSRLRCAFSSRKPTFIESNEDSNSTFSISKKSPPSLAHNSFDVEMSAQVQSEELGKAREASNSSLALKGSQVMQGFQPQTAKAPFMSNMEHNAESISVHIQLDSRKQNSTFVNDGNAEDGKSKSKMIEPLLEEKLNSHVDDDSAKENCRPKKRMRENMYENEDDVNGDQNIVGSESRTAVITENAAVKDCHTEVSHHCVSESLKLQLYSSLPIDEPIWSGIIKTCSNEYVSLAAHLSTKYCQMVSKLSRSLQPVLEVTKLSRLEAWPKSFETSRPTDDNIALYFFPDKMRQDADLDQLVKEVIENDMVLRAVVDEAEMLIFPSVLLPEQYQSFQGKPYLWGVFRPRKKKFAIVEEQHGISHCAQEEMGKQQAAHRGVGKKGHMVAGLNMGVGPETPKEAEGQGMEQKQTLSVAPPNTPIPVEDIAWATSAPTMPATMSANDGHRPTSVPTMPAAMSANDGQIHSSFSIPTGAMLGFVVRQTPRIEFLIEEMQREGAVVVAMRGEMIGSGLGQAVVTG